jgi:hypothetical protein
MNSNLPVKQDNNLFGKIKIFFRKLFFKEKIEYNYEERMEVQPEFEKDDNRKKKFEENIKVETNNDYINEMKREEFLDKLESNPKLLYDLPIEKLEKLESYYGESIKKQEEKLAKLKKAS